MNTEQHKKIKVIVAHGSYGCDTGCCGHWVELETGDRVGDFQFAHPYGDDFREWALEFAQERVTEIYGPDHVADLDWENSFISDD